MATQIGFVFDCFCSFVYFLRCLLFIHHRHRYKLRNHHQVQEVQHPKPCIRQAVERHKFICRFVHRTNHCRFLVLFFSFFCSIKFEINRKFTLFIYTKSTRDWFVCYFHQLRVSGCFDHVTVLSISRNKFSVHFLSAKIFTWQIYTTEMSQSRADRWKQVTKFDRKTKLFLLFSFIHLMQINKIYYRYWIYWDKLQMAKNDTNWNSINEIDETKKSKQK